MGFLINPSLEELKYVFLVFCAEKGGAFSIRRTNPVGTVHQL